MNEGQLETTEAEVAPEQQELDHWLTLAGECLGHTITACLTSDSPAEQRAAKQKKALSGARLNQLLVERVVNGLDCSNPHELRQRKWLLHHALEAFYAEFKQLVGQHFIDAFRALGLDPKKIDPQEALNYVRILEQGVKGAVAACLMAQACGYKVEFPTVYDDVFGHVDIILCRGETKIPAQVKCASNLKLKVYPDEDNPTLLIINVPGHRDSFQEPETLGIPHTTHIERFREFMESFLPEPLEK